MVTFSSFITTLGLCGLIPLACYAGDHLLHTVSTSYPNNIRFRALVDTCTHAIVGGISWAVVESDSLLVDLQSWIRCVACFLLSMFLDIDHFLMAGSFDLQKAVNLAHRPPFHNTSLIIAVVFICWILNRYAPFMSIISLIILCACLSHHLRDANHRGLWLYPFGHTQVFSFVTYVFCIITLALGIRFVFLYVLIRPPRRVSFGGVSII